MDPIQAPHSDAAEAKRIAQTRLPGAARASPPGRQNTLGLCHRLASGRVLQPRASSLLEPTQQAKAADQVAHREAPGRSPIGADRPLQPCP